MKVEYLRITKKVLVRFCCLSLLISFIFPDNVFSQKTYTNNSAPTDNPYTTKYPGFENTNHWTDSIPWKNVKNVRSARFVNTTSEGDTNWLKTYENAAMEAQKEGGGVVYFPSRGLSDFGNSIKAYQFDSNLILYDNVVIRGDNPKNLNAKDSTYTLGTKFEFPEYIYSSISRKGTPNNSAFKAIKSEPGASNTGLVYININRARINISPEFEEKEAPAGNTTTLPKNYTSNIIVFGIINNNAAIPSPDVPDFSIGQDTSQRYSWRFGFNINVYADDNIVVCNNRLNNNVTDNFGMNKYAAEGQDEDLDSEQARFSYTNHYGIFVNRFKLKSLKLGTYNCEAEIGNFKASSTPREEPQLFAEGVEIKDNWVYKTMRVGIQAGGMGMIIKDNEIHDKRGKKIWLDQTGTEVLNKKSNWENRGIDFTGWNVKVLDNYIEVFRQEQMGASGEVYSQDGEGFFCQGFSSATQRNYLISGNKVITQTDIPDISQETNIRGLNGVVNGDHISNVTIKNNDVGQMPLKVIPNSSGGTYMVDNVVIENNTNVRGITLQGPGEGSAGFILNNEGLPCPQEQKDNGDCKVTQDNKEVCEDCDITYSCNVFLNNDRISDQFDPNYENSNPLLKANQCIDGDDPHDCYPEISLLNPASDTALFVSGKDTTIPLIVKIHDCSNDNSYVPDQIKFINGENTIGTVEPKSGADRDTLNWKISDDTTEHMITAEASSFNKRKKPQTVFSRTDMHVIKINKPMPNVDTVTNSHPCDTCFKVIETGIANKQYRNNNIKIYPNPAGNYLNIKIENNKAGKYNLNIYNLMGSQVQSKTIRKGAGYYNERIDISKLSSGSYILKTINNEGILDVEMIIKE